jgi:signal peptidase I
MTAFEIINKTLHIIRLFNNKNEVIVTYKPDKNPIRLTEHLELLYYAEDLSDTLLTKIPIFKKSFIGNKIGLPSEDVEFSPTLYIVSLPVAQAYPERHDFIVVHDVVRDEKGAAIGCKSFAFI